MTNPDPSHPVIVSADVGPNTRVWAEDRDPTHDRHLMALALGASDPSRPPSWAAELMALPSGDHTLSGWLMRYLSIRLGGRSPHTVAARGRDLLAFCRWFQTSLGHQEIGGWMPAHTHHYLRHLETRGLAPTSINRALWSLKHFAGWVVRQPGGIFARWGHPAEEAREIKVDEAPCKKITDAQSEALFALADQRAATPSRHPLERPWRDRAILAVLATCGLRVSEMVGLMRSQYRDQDLHQVSRKGGGRSRSVLLCRSTRARLDDYLEREWASDTRPSGAQDKGTPSDRAAPAAGPHLFVAARSGLPLDRARVARILARLAALASAASESETGRAGWHVHPHQLRHTFGARYRAASGSDTETAEVLGHASLKYVGRYVRKSNQERRQLLEDIFDPPAATAPASVTPEGPSV